MTKPQYGHSHDPRLIRAVQKHLTPEGRVTARGPRDVVWLTGKCTKVDPETLFISAPPGKGSSNLVTKAADAVCGKCDLRDECLASALDRRDNWGVYGGVTRAIRSRMATEWHKLKDERRKAAREG